MVVGSVEDQVPLPLEFVARTSYGARYTRWCFAHRQGQLELGYIRLRPFLQLHGLPHEVIPVVVAHLDPIDRLTSLGRIPVHV